MSRAVLLDTHIFLWVLAEPTRLTAMERQAIDLSSRRYVSAVTYWEIAMLISLGRIDHDQRLFSPVGGIGLLPVLPDHCRILMDLPQIHRDPFDRMLIAQARAEGLSLLTRDSKIIGYGTAGAMIASAES